MGLEGLIAGSQVEVVGISDQEDGSLKVYLTHRSAGTFVLIDDQDAQAQVRAAWAGSRRVLIPTPPSDRIHTEDDIAATGEEQR